MRLVGVVLAAGAARRFGADKLAAPFNGEPLLHNAIRAARAAPVEWVVVVASPGLDIGRWDGAPTVEVVPLRSDSLSMSLKAGIAAAGDAAGALVFLGDMPLVPHDLAGRLAAALDGHFAAMPRYNGKPGHPVLLARHAFPAIAGLKGDEGAGKLLRQRADVLFVDVDDAGVHADVDLPEDIGRLEAESASRGQ